MTLVYDTFFLPELAGSLYTRPAYNNDPFIAAEGVKYPPLQNLGTGGATAARQQNYNGISPTVGPFGGCLFAEYGPSAGFANITAQGQVGFDATPQGRAVCAWSDPNNGNKITIAIRDYDQTNQVYAWLAPFTTDETSFTGVAVCFAPADNDAVVVVWAGTDLGSAAQGTINYANMNFHDRHLSDKQSFWGQTSLYTPAVAVNNEFTFIAWTGNDEAHSLNLITLGPGTNFTQIQLNEQSLNSPRLTWIDNSLAPALLHLTWLGTDGELNILAFDPGSEAGNKFIIPTTMGSLCAPTLLASVLDEVFFYIMWLDQAGVPWVSYCPASNALPPAPYALVPALGLMASYTVDLACWGVAMAWDNAGDGLQFGYLGVPVGAPNLVEGDFGNLMVGTPTVSAISLNPAQWTYG